MNFQHSEITFDNPIKLDGLFGIAAEYVEVAELILDMREALDHPAFASELLTMTSAYKSYVEAYNKWQNNLNKLLAAK